MENFEDPRYLVELPDALADWGFIIEQLATIKHTLRTAVERRLLPQKRVVCVGLGALGLLMAAELVDMEMEVVGFDIYASGPRREAFDMLGKRATFVQSNPHAVQIHADTFPLVIELAGGPRSLADAVNPGPQPVQRARETYRRPMAGPSPPEALKE